MPAKSFPDLKWVKIRGGVKHFSGRKRINVFVPVHKWDILVLFGSQRFQAFWTSRRCCSPSVTLHVLFFCLQP